jgi:hypothetical protein
VPEVATLAHPWTEEPANIKATFGEQFHSLGPDQASRTRHDCNGHATFSPKIINECVLFLKLPYTIVEDSSNS